MGSPISLRSRKGCLELGIILVMASISGVSAAYLAGSPSTLLSSSSSSSSLPSYQDPITLSPPLLPQLDACCELSHRQQIIHGASFTSAGQLWVEPYQYEKPSTDHHDKDGIERIILEFDGSISGVQYDRFGAVWVDGIELLRTTTPEPPGDGNGVISWSVQRDVTDYASALMKSNKEEGEEEVYAAIVIPNTVNDEYTGVIEVNCTLSFYRSKASTAQTNKYLDNGSLSVKKRPTVMNLNPAFVKVLHPNAPSSPLNLLGVETNTIQNHTLKRDDFPTDFLMQQSSSSPSPQNHLLGRVYLDVYASGHECEEFYYTNMPSSLIPKNSSANVCGGGPAACLMP